MAYLTTELCDVLTSEHIESLNQMNIWTINDLLVCDLIQVRQTTNIKFHILKEIYDKVKQKYTIPCNDLNFSLEKSIEECKMCPTGIPELTLALDGGFQTQEIVEFFGDSGSGKTELCYLVCGEILSHFNDYNVLYVASNYDIDHEKIIKYSKLKAGGRQLSDEDIFNYLSRVQMARPTKLADFVHLLNTLLHSDKRNLVKCIIVDSLSFIIQEDILDIKTSNLNDGDELVKFSALKGNSIELPDQRATVENVRRYLTDIYLHEVMKLLTNIALIKNVIVIITNSDQQLAFSKSWTNAIDHRIHLTKMPEFSRHCILNPKATVLKATISKTIHNITKIGYSVPFLINDEGLFAIRLSSTKLDQSSETSSEGSPKSN